MAMVSVIWVIIGFVVGVLVAGLIAWISWQRRADELDQDARAVRSELNERIRLLRQQEVTIDQLEGRVREGEVRRRQLGTQIAESEASVERLQAEPSRTEGQPDAAAAADPTAELAEAVQDSGGALDPETVVRDDLRRVEGIGPKIAGLLNQAGIHSFSALAGTGTDRLAEILQQGGIRLADPTTWPQQAGLAAEDKWEELQALQDQLQGGRRA